MKLSIITINYNNVEGLKRTMDSICPYLKQTQDIEYIVIDGGSNDNSPHLIDKYRDVLTYAISEPDKGIFNAMNKGAEKANGKYLLYMNSGDILNKNIDINRILDSLTGEDLIYYDIDMLNVTDGIMSKKEVYDEIDFKFMIESTLPHQSTFIKKEKQICSGGYKEYTKIAGDWCLFIDLVCKYKCSLKHVKETFSTYYLDGLSSQHENHAKLWLEKESHLNEFYSLYYTFYQDWRNKQTELYRIKNAVSVKALRKIGFLKWVKEK